MNNNYYNNSNGSNQNAGYGYYYRPPYDNNFDPEAARREFERFAEETKRRDDEKRTLKKIGNYVGLCIIGYIVLSYALILIFTPLGFYDYYYSSTIFQYGFNVVYSVIATAMPFAIMYLCNKKKYNAPLIPTKPLNKKDGVLWVGFGIGVCVIADYAVSFLMSFVENLFGYELTQSDSSTPDSIFACVLYAICIAIIPPICEEFAFRCCTLGILRKYGKGFTVFSVSIIFGLMHGNVIQFVFAFIVGLVLAYVTIQTDNIIPAICIHALNNGLSAVSDIVNYAAGEKASNTAIVVLYVLYLLAGIICAVVLALKDKYKIRENGESKSLLTTGEKVKALFLNVPMVIALIYLILTTASTVQKI